MSDPYLPTPPGSGAQVISFYEAAAARGRPIPATGRLAALADLLRDEERAKALLGQPRWHGQRELERDMARNTLLSRWQSGSLDGHQPAAHLAALLALELGVAYDRAAAAAEGVALLSWLLEDDLARQPELVRHNGNEQRRRLHCDVGRLGFSDPDLDGLDLAVTIAPSPARFPMLANLGWAHIAPAVPTPISSGHFVSALLAFSPSWEPLSLPAAAANYALVLNLDVSGLPHLPTSSAPEITRLALRLRARQEALAVEFALAIGAAAGTFSAD